MCLFKLDRTFQATVCFCASKRRRGVAERRIGGAGAVLQIGETSERCLSGAPVNSPGDCSPREFANAPICSTAPGRPAGGGTTHG